MKSESELDDVAAGLVEHHRYHHHGGTTLFIALSLDTLVGSAQQRVAVERIRATLHARMEPARLAEQRLIAVLSDGLASGTIDDAKVDTAMLDVRAAAATVRDASADAMNALHTALDPAQRAALLDKVDAHWRVWQQANVDDDRPSSRDVRSLAMLTEELSLTSDEVEKMRAGMGLRMSRVTPLVASDVDRELRVFREAFRNDAFDAKLAASSSVVDARLATWGVSHMANLAETAALVLTPAQRLKLAQLLREHADHAAIAAAAL